MRITSLNTCLALFGIGQTSAFTLSSHSFHRGPQSSVNTVTIQQLQNELIPSSAASTTSLHMALTAKDILARARKAAGVPEEEEEEAPKIFEDNLLDDMQKALLSLEKRVKGGPGSLSHDEIGSLDQRLDRIIEEMKEFNNQLSESPAPARTQFPSQAQAPPQVQAQAPPAYAPPQVQAQAPPTYAPPQVQAQAQAPPTYAPPQVQAQAPPQPQQPPTPQQQELHTLTDLPRASGPGDVEHNPEEGAAYEGKGGLGLASGTANTWLIENMDEMTGEEYRLALQESVSARQRDRRASGLTGNLASNNYLDSL